MAACSHSFDPGAWETELPDVEVDIDERWNCSHPAVEDHEKCIFHLSPQERENAGLEADDVRERFLERIATDEPGSAEFIDTHFRDLDLNDTTIPPVRGEQLDLRYCTIEGYLRLENTRVEPKLNCRGSEIQRIRMDDAQFESDAQFYGCEVSGTVHADDTTFKNKALFARSRFGATVRFGKCPFFQRKLVLTGAEFTSNLKITGGTVAGRAYFREVDVHRLKLRKSTFEEAVLFSEATFDREADFTATQFDGPLHLGRNDPKEGYRPATFNCEGKFDEADFRDIADFTGTNVSDRLNFNDVTCEKIRLCPTPAFNGLVCVDFPDATVHAGQLDQPSAGTVLYDFRDSVVGDLRIDDDTVSALDEIRFIKTTFEGFDFTLYRRAIEAAENTIHCFDVDPELRARAEKDRKEKPTEREITYQKAKSGADTIGDNRVASKFHIQEMRARRDRFDEEGRGWDAFQNRLFDISCRYGESPRQVIFGAGVVVIIYSAVFALLYRVSATSGPYQDLPMGLGYALLSLEAFNGLVLGGGPDITNLIIRSIASLETFTGGFFIALFLFSLTRSIHR